MFFSRWCYSTSFWFLVPELPPAILEDLHLPSSFASARGITGSHIITACVSGVVGALLRLMSHGGALGWRAPTLYLGVLVSWALLPQQWEREGEWGAGVVGASTVYGVVRVSSAASTDRVLELWALSG